jgi:hypothetical protein
MNYYDSPLRLLIYYKTTNTCIRNEEISTSYNKEKVDIVDLVIQKFNTFTNPIPIYIPCLHESEYQ